MSSYNFSNLTIGGSTIDLSNSVYGSSGTISLGAVGSGGSTNIWSTSATSYTWPTTSTDRNVSLDHNGIYVTEEADIKIGKVSLKEFIARIEQRLALLNPNPELEKEWEELKELGDRYRALEKDIKEKMKTWEILKREDDSV